jgi:hypothetical protein
MKEEWMDGEASGWSGASNLLQMMMTLVDKFSNPTITLRVCYCTLKMFNVVLEVCALFNTS